MHRLCRKRNRPVWHRFMHMPPACAIMIRSLSREKNDHSNGWSFFLEKVLRFDRKRLKVGHRLFRGVHFYLGGCKRQRGCKVNEIGIVEKLPAFCIKLCFLLCSASTYQAKTAHRLAFQNSLLLRIHTSKSRSFFLAQVYHP